MLEASHSVSHSGKNLRLFKQVINQLSLMRAQKKDILSSHSHQTPSYLGLP